MAIDPRTDPHARLVTTPLPSKMAKGAEGGTDAKGASDPGATATTGADATQATATGANQAAPKPRDPFLRAPNEDDDGYDPYSDRPAENPFFERDPWD